MAASIRVRVTEVRVGNAPLDDLIEPFWLLVSGEKLPFISDVGKRILATCNSSQHRLLSAGGGGKDAKAEDVPSVFSSATLPLTTPEHISCQLWLDGCRLPDSERTEILRDNDCIVFNILEHDSSRGAEFFPKRLNSGTEEELMKPTLEKRKISKSVDPDVLSNILEVPKKSKKKRKRDNELLDNREKKQKRDDSFKHILSPELSSTRMEEVSFANNSLSSSSKQDLVNQSDLSSCHKMKKKKKKKSQLKESVSFNDKVTAKNVCKTNINSVDVDHPDASPPDLVPNSDIEEQKRKLLGKLDAFVKSKTLSPTADEDGMICDVSVESKKRKRRRQKKKPKNKEESKVIERVEDKPRSSVLNLPWDMQPQNSKITFDSSSDSDSGEDEKSGKTKYGNQHDAPEGVKNLGDAQVNMKQLKEVRTNDADNRNEEIVNENSFECEPNSTPKRYKDLSLTSRKYIMRSTSGILDSLRSNNNTEGHNESGFHSSLFTKPVTGIKESRKNSKADVIKSENESFGVVKTTIVESGLRQTSDTCSGGKYAQPKATSSPYSSRDKPGFITSSPSPSVDYDAKFNELLQRRKLSSTSCNVRQSENGITICSRNKSPRRNNCAQMNRLADPTTDVLSNVSTIRSSNGTTDSSGTSSQKCATRGSGRSAVPMAGINGRGGDTDLEKVEVTPLDVENCPRLAGDPFAGDILAYKILEMSEDYTPVVSDFKTGKVLCFEGDLVTLKLFGSPAPRKPNGKFELVYDEEEEDPTGKTLTDERVSVQLASMMDTRLVQRYSDDEGRR